MEFRKVLALRGPNIWANFTVLEAWVDLGALKDSPSNEIPGFNERLMAWLPTMIEHRCSIGERGGFFERLRRGTYQAHILEHVTLELQSLAGTSVGYGRARETSEDGVYKVVVQYRDEELARACLETARELCLAAVYDRPFDVEAEVAKLHALNEKVRLGPSTGAMVEAARKRGIPTRRLNDDSIVQLGYGACAKRINTAETSQTPATAEAIAQDKELTRSLLRQVGVPVPEGRPVNDSDDAWAAAQEIGGPVVVKPRYGNHGTGVVTNLSTREQVVAGYLHTSNYADYIVVERFVTGEDFRLLVVGGKLVAAARREPAQVVADGVHTIEQLVEEVNRDPRRSIGHSNVLSKIQLDAIELGTLAEQGYGLDSVPGAGTTVILRRNANLSTGGTATDVTDLVHPEIAARAIDAALAVGLDIAGIDVIARDITRPLEVQDGVVVEVNAGPGLRMHLEPSSGKPRAVGEAIIDYLFPDGENGRIPIVAITGVNGKTTTTRLIAHLVKLSGKTVGMTCTDGIVIDGRLIDRGDCSGPQSARAVLMNPRVQAAVLETARGGILREGLGFDVCDVGIVTNIGEGDHLGLAEVETPEKLAQVKRTVIEAVAPWGTGVLNADDPLVSGMPGYCPGSVTFFSRSADSPVIAAHRAKGGRAVFVRDGMLTLAEGALENMLLPVGRVALTLHARIGFQVENVLAATAAAWALELSPATICEALLTFTSDTKTTPGRFNVLHHGGATIIIDYGHNSSALLALGDAIAQLPHERRSIVFAAAGDRRDVDIIRQGTIVGDVFDHVILYEDACNRGRADGVPVGLLRQGLARSTRVSSIYETRGELNAVEHALNGLKPGDLLLIQADTIDLLIAHIERFLQNLPAWTEPEPVVVVSRLEPVAAWAD
jgi:cyanophycin synthetase